MWKCPNLLIRNSFTVGGGVCAQEECLPMGMCPGGVWPGECQQGSVSEGVSSQGVAAQEECLPKGVYTLWTQCQTPPIACWDTHTLPIACWDTPPPPERRNDTHLWKHYLSVTTVAGSNNWILKLVKYARVQNDARTPGIPGTKVLSGCGQVHLNPPPAWITQSWPSPQGLFAQAKISTSQIVRTMLKC